MFLLVTYDVNTTTKEGVVRLRKIARICQNYGQCVQDSVFECSLDWSDVKELKSKLEKIMNVEEDSIRYYHLGNQYATKIEHVGKKISYDFDGPLFG